MNFKSMQSLFVNAKFDTPSFVYDENKLLQNLKVMNDLCGSAGCNVLFSLKAFSYVDVLSLISVYVDGFSVSSVHEAKLANDILGDQKIVHITTPGLRAEDMDVISELCDSISYNSLSQFSKYHDVLYNRLSCGLRINPQLSFINDDRYDPCQKNSKLGVPLDILKVALPADKNLAMSIKGIHFHTNCESDNLSQLFATVRHVQMHIPELLRRIEWINLGGGYFLKNLIITINLGISLIS